MQNGGCNREIAIAQRKIIRFCWSVAFLDLMRPPFEDFACVPTQWLGPPL